MSVRISYAAARVIAEHGHEQHPKEACGLLAGDGQRISRAIPLSNAADAPLSNFALEPNQQLRTLKAFDAEGLVWMGVYHSHPASPAIPSAADIHACHDESLLHIIVSLRNPGPEFKLWRIEDSGATPVELRFDLPSNAAHEEDRLSARQRTAVALAGLISVILMIVISLTLLPPAPVLSHLP